MQQPLGPLGAHFLVTQVDSVVALEPATSLCMKSECCSAQGAENKARVLKSWNYFCELMCCDLGVFVLRILENQVQKPFLISFYFWI